MPILAPIFREINFNRIKDLKRAGLSDTTIAGVVNDETNNAYHVTPQDITGYFKVTEAGSDKMLVRQNTARTIAQADRRGKLA